MTSITAVGLALLALGSLAQVARADSGELLLLPVERASKVPAQKAKQVNESLAESAVGMRVVPEAERRTAGRADCGSDLACWTGIGRALKARRIVACTMTTAAPKLYTVSILLVDVASGVLLSHGERKVAVAALATLPRKLLADVLWQAPPASRDPIPAPATAELAPAPPPPDSALAYEPPTESERAPHRPSLLRPLKWAAAGGALAALATGAALWAIDGRDGCAKAPGQRQCPDQYDTLAGGATLVAVGVALAAVSTVLFVLDHRARRRWSSAVLPGPTGVLATAGGRF